LWINAATARGRNSKTEGATRYMIGIATILTAELADVDEPENHIERKKTRYKTKYNGI